MAEQVTKPGTAEIARALVIGRDEAKSYWQPVPANGFIRNILSQAITGGEASFSLGTQTVAPQCFIREHTHSDNEEVIHLPRRPRHRPHRWRRATRWRSAPRVYVGRNPPPPLHQPQ